MSLAYAHIMASLPLAYTTPSAPPQRPTKLRPNQCPISAPSPPLSWSTLSCATNKNVSRRGARLSLVYGHIMPPPALAYTTPSAPPWCPAKLRLDQCCVFVPSPSLSWSTLCLRALSSIVVVYIVPLRHLLYVTGFFSFTFCNESTYKGNRNSHI